MITGLCGCARVTEIWNTERGLRPELGKALHCSLNERIGLLASTELVIRRVRPKWWLCDILTCYDVPLWKTGEENL